MKITRFEDIEGWKKARELLKKVCEAVKSPGFERDWDIQRQLRRAALSVMANVAEGFDGGSDAEFCRFLRIAKRSATEVQSHLYAALDQAYLTKSQFDALYERAAETQRVIGGFIRYLNGRKSK
jgi:four helix bundle protein